MQGFIPPADHISNHCYKLTMCFFKDTLNLKQTVEKLCDDDVVGGEVLNAKIVMLFLRQQNKLLLLRDFVISLAGGYLNFFMNKTKVVRCRLLDVMSGILFVSLQQPPLEIHRGHL